MMPTLKVVVEQRKEKWRLDQGRNKEGGKEVHGIISTRYLWEDENKAQERGGWGAKSVRSQYKLANTRGK